MGVRGCLSVRQAFWESVSLDLHLNVYSRVWLNFFLPLKIAFPEEKKKKDRNSASTVFSTTVVVLKTNIQYS